jgi:hypothetical protein
MHRKDARPTPRNARADAGTPVALTCADVRAREWEFAEGSLPTPERTAVQAHLDGCESCRRELTLCRSAEGALLAASAQIPPAGDLRAGFYGRLAAQRRQPRRYGRPLALSAVAVGVLALVLVRPALKTLFIPQPGPDNGTVARSTPPPSAALVSAPPSASSPTKLPDENLPDFKLTPRPGLPGLPYATTRRRVAKGMATSTSHLRRGEALGLLAVHGRIVRLPHLPPVVLADANTVHDRDAYIKFPPGRPDAEILAKTAVDALAPGNSPPELALGATFMDRRAEVPQIMASMPGEAGVSLAVTDQVRGFSNVTRVASDFEVQDGDSTIHVEADGN